MGDFMGHVLPGTLLLAVGLWRVWLSVARYAADPAAFRVRAWNPVPVPAVPRLLELYVVAGGAFLDMCVELLYASPLRSVLTGGGGGDDAGPAADAHLGGLEHAGMLLMFFLFGALALASDKNRWLPPLPDAALSLVFASAFTAEFLLFRFHSATHAGVEGYYHGHLLALLGLCVAAVVAGALLPSSFPADLGAGVLIAVQGMWFYQTALTLYGPMLPAGCARRFDTPRSDARVECGGGGGGAAQERAEQLADFQLFVMVLLAFVYALGCYAVAAARCCGSNLEMTTGRHEHVVAATTMEECTI